MGLGSSPLNGVVPPPATRFKKGRSGNPSGRRPIDRDEVARLERAIRGARRALPGAVAEMVRLVHEAKSDVVRIGAFRVLAALAQQPLPGDRAAAPEPGRTYGDPLERLRRAMEHVLTQHPAPASS